MGNANKHPPSNGYTSPSFSADSKGEIEGLFRFTIGACRLTLACDVDLIQNSLKSTLSSRGKGSRLILEGSKKTNELWFGGMIDKLLFSRYILLVGDVVLFYYCLIFQEDDPRPQLTSGEPLNSGQPRHIPALWRSRMSIHFGFQLPICVALISSIWTHLKKGGGKPHSFLLRLPLA